MITISQWWPAVLFLSLLVIVLLHFFLRRPPRKIVSSLLLWRRGSADQSRRALRVRFRFSWLLWLQLAAAALLVVALMEPSGQGLGAGQPLVVILDASFSMQAVDVEPDRFRAAKIAAREFMAEQDNRATAIIAAAGQPRLLHNFTADQNALGQALDTAAVTGEAVDMGAALDLAASLLPDGGGGEIVVFSDGAYDPPQVDAAVPTKLVTIGTESHNMALIGLQAMPAGSEGRWDLMARVANYDSIEREVVLGLYADDQLLQAVLLQVPAAEDTAVVFSVDVSGRRRFEFRLESDDMLPGDDRGWIAVGRDEEPRVLLVSADGFFLERALLAYPGLRFFRASAPPPNMDLFDVVIFDQIMPEQPAAAGMYVLNLPQPWQERWNWQIHDRPLGITGADSFHPLLRFVGDTGLQAAMFSSLAVKPEAELLWDVEGRAAAAAGSDQGRRWVFVGIPLEESNFPLTIGFPLFVANAIEWLLPEAVETAGAVPAAAADIAPRWDGSVLELNRGPSEPDLTVIRLAPLLLVAALVFIALEWLVFGRSGVHGN